MRFETMITRGVQQSNCSDVMKLELDLGRGITKEGNGMDSTLVHHITALYVKRS